MNTKKRKSVMRTAAAVLAVALTLLCAELPPWGGMAHAAGLAPVAENLNYETFRNVAITGRLAAVDPEGETVTFRICEKPGKGTVELGEDGMFTYTPLRGKKGRDSFSYIAADQQGNESSPAVVMIEIRKQSTSVAYADMAGNSANYAALCLAEQDIFIGQQLGGEYFFCPDAEVTRSEFLAMCMRACGAETMTGVAGTGFYDDAEISDWAKPYVATALMAGLIEGYENDEGRTVFAPDMPVTMAEAVVMLDNILEITDISDAIASAECPEWACQAAANLSGCGVDTFYSAYADTLTRGEAADMLLGALKILDNRPSGFRLSWMA